MEQDFLSRVKLTKTENNPWDGVLSAAVFKMGQAKS